MITEQQRKDRKNFLGGSDMAAILGVSPYKTAYQLYLEKKDLFDESPEENEVQYWGNRMESVLREEYERRTLQTVIVPNEPIEHPLYPFLKANVDGLVGINSVWEAKTCSQFMAHLWGEEGSDIIPIQYLVQVAFYCAVTNRMAADLSVLIGGNDYRQYVYCRDFNLERRIIDAACDFWDALQSNTPPPPANLMDLKLLFPQSIPLKTKQYNQEISESYNSLKLIKKQMQLLEEEEKKERFKITNFMEDSECLVNEMGHPLCTWKSNKKGSRTFLLKNND